MRKGSDCIALATAKVVGSFRESVSSVSVFIHPVGQFRCDGPYRADCVGNRFPVAVVILVKLMPTNREVDGGRLVGVEVNSIWIGVLLSGHAIVVMYRKHLQDEVWRWRPRHRRWR